jgi:NADPH:quinone reductase
MPMKVSVKQFGGPDSLQLESLDPTTAFRCLPNQVIVRVHAFGINPVETYIRSGLYEPLPSLPYTPGTDGAGVVTEIGCDVSREDLVVGTRVWLTGSVSGTYASYCVCYEEDVHVLPAEYTFEQGAAIGVPYRTAYRAITMLANCQRGESILVQGASGGVGLAALQLARLLGMYPIYATTSSEEREMKDLLTDNGAHYVVKHGECTELVDVVIEALANVNLSKDLKILKKYGRVVIVGCRGDATITPRDLMRCEGKILGMVGPGTPTEKAACDEAIQHALREKTISPVVGHIFDLNDVGMAHDEVMTHALGTKGKIVVRTVSSTETRTVYHIKA